MWIFELLSEPWAIVVAAIGLWSLVITSVISVKTKPAKVHLAIGLTGFCVGIWGYLNAAMPYIIIT